MTHRNFKFDSHGKTPPKGFSMKLKSTGKASMCLSLSVTHFPISIGKLIEKYSRHSAIFKKSICNIQKEPISQLESECFLQGYNLRKKEVTLQIFLQLTSFSYQMCSNL